MQISLVAQEKDNLRVSEEWSGQELLSLHRDLYQLHTDCVSAVSILTAAQEVFLMWKSSWCQPNQSLLSLSLSLRGAKFDRFMKEAGVL